MISIDDRIISVLEALDVAPPGSDLERDVVAQALRDVQRETAERCLRIFNDEGAFTGSVIIERFGLKEKP